MSGAPARVSRAGLDGSHMVTHSDTHAEATRSGILCDSFSNGSTTLISLATRGGKSLLVRNEMRDIMARAGGGGGGS